MHFVIGKLIDHGRQILFGHGFSLPCLPAAPEEPRNGDPDERRSAAPPLIDPRFLAERDDLER